MTFFLKPVFLSGVIIPSGSLSPYCFLSYSPMSSSQ